MVPSISGFVHVLEVNEKTLFIPLTDIYPECYEYRRPFPSLSPLHCFSGACRADKRCMEKLPIRLNLLFAKFPKAELILATFKSLNGQADMGCEFWKDFREPRTRALNPAALKLFRTQFSEQTLELPELRGI